MADLDVLISQPPQGSHGAPIEQSYQLLNWDFFNWDEEVWGFPSWRLAVEIAIPGVQGAIWGQSLWGQANWSQVAWRDLTPYNAGIRVTRGSEPGSRPEPGVLTITLNNNAPHPFAPWSASPFAESSYMGAGTLIRVSLHDPGLNLWQPLYGGIVEDWQETYQHHNSGVGFVTVTAIETATLLNRVNDFALGAPVGLDDTPSQRIQRLLDAADWLYGFTSTSTSIEPLQSTDMAQSRLTEAYLVADSIDAVFRTARNGSALLEDKDTSPIMLGGSAYANFVLSHTEADDPSGYQIPYEDESLVVSNNDDLLNNVVLLQANGGAELSYENVASKERYSPRYFQRSNLQYKVANEATASDYIADRVLARSATYRPYSCRVNADHGKAVKDFLSVVDLGQVTDVHTPNALFENVTIVGLVHNITPLQDRINWTCDITFNTSATYAWTAL